MNLSPIIGHFKGIPIELHWSLLLILIFSLFISIPLFLILVILFACVLLHEMAHSLTAYNNNVPVEKIILYPLGGGSMIDSNDLTPDLEFRISIAGPIASFLIGFVFGIFAIIMPGGEIALLLQIFFLLNILLAVFNIVPWFPLDGGRVMRGYFRKKLEFIKATQKTVMVSNVITILFILGTFVFVALTNYSLYYKELIVILDVFMAVFIYSGAKSEMQLAYLRKYTKKLSIKKLISSNFIMFNYIPTLKDIYNAILKYHTHVVLFKDENKYFQLSKLSSLNFNNVNNRQYINMEVPLQTIDYNEKVYDVFNKMQNSNLSMIGVVKDNKFIGIISREHMNSFILLHMSNLNLNQKSNSSGA